MNMRLMIYLSQSVLQLYQTKRFLRKTSGWISNSVINCNIKILKYNSLAGRSYQKNLDDTKKMD